MLFFLLVLLACVFACCRREISNQDKGCKRSKKRKEELKFKTDSGERLKVLYQRRKGLFQVGFKLTTMTGADVLIIVQNDREQRFYATGPLWDEYLGGRLHGTSKEEVKDTDCERCGSGPVVAPLETTPSPRTGQKNSSRVSAIVGNPLPHKRLSLSSTVVEGDVPEPVRKLLADRSIPVVLDSDMCGQPDEVENNQPWPSPV